MLKCCWAGLDENGTTGWNGKAKAGDQTGMEVRVDNWYYFGQTCVFRWKDRKKAKEFSKVIEALCNNENVGYDQSERYTLNDWLKTHAYDYKALNTPVECDCSALVLSAINVVEGKQAVSGGTTTATMEKELDKTNLFEKHKTDNYLVTPCELLEGDLVNAPNNHIIAVLEDCEACTKNLTTTIKSGHKKGDTLSAKDFDTKYDGKNVTGWSAIPLKLSKESNLITIVYKDKFNTFIYDCKSGKTAPYAKENKNDVVAAAPILYPSGYNYWCLVKSEKNIKVYTEPTTDSATLKAYPELANGNGVTILGQSYNGLWAYVLIAEKYKGWVESPYLIYDKSMKFPAIIQSIVSDCTRADYVAKVQKVPYGDILNVRVAPSSSSDTVKVYPALGNGNLVDVIGTNGIFSLVNIVGVKGWVNSYYLIRV